ncbi:predicted protein [Postia placenta Mad-698-R]|uniref:Uncharacterized protein n=1 Tax=Postia placenta MAD-698-R-SB12 TaxID=670580 RepID=A0A1X6MWU3_9APHY|nr:hypothetical protein POSPLADRAFT_1047187 [Postia placenta MAD-698-R-SB12]EED85068.1 predicted protein [Postia placenta Mad-698-R]OSX60834.1 hypothetical protein POSPLADRAFT_1047187 [Postia placenta MAD-698-R-SB12]
MSPCYNCSARPRLASIDFGTVPLQAGDVCHIQESLMRPIESALKVNLKKLMSIVTLGNHTIDTSRTQDSLWPGFKDRPCVITEVDTSGPQQKVTHCVLSTMNGKRIETLPYAIRKPRGQRVLSRIKLSQHKLPMRAGQGTRHGSHHRSDLHVVHNLRQTNVNKSEQWKRWLDNDATFSEHMRVEYTNEDQATDPLHMEIDDNEYRYAVKNLAGPAIQEEVHDESMVAITLIEII